MTRRIADKLVAAAGTGTWLPRPVAELRALLDAGRSAVTRSVDCRLITPMFGGGPQTGRVDPSMPVSAKGIRGQLRFWWRATRGAARCATTDQLAEAEAAIFGTAEEPSRLQIVVRRIEPLQVKTEPCAQWDRRPDGRYRLNWKGPFGGFDNPLRYVAFPFQGTAPNSDKLVEPGNFLADLRFVVDATGPAETALEVEAALWAWSNFGGCGARTRRGCGAVFSADFAPGSAGEIADWLNEAQARYALNFEAERDWPTLARAVLTGGKPSGALEAWKTSVGEMLAFRQGEAGHGNGVGRNEGDPALTPHRPGRSRWPEPESLRAATNRRAGKHQRLEHVPNDAYPRAELGLPIIFHFAPQPQGNPEDTELYPVVDGQRRTRMASPVILRPLGLGSGKAVPMVAALRTPVLEACHLVRHAQDTKPLKTIESDQIRRPALATYKNSPLQNLDSGAPRSLAGSAVEAFTTFVQEHGFRRVT
jgi:CRISPR-associated protein Cmr1